MEQQPQSQQASEKNATASNEPHAKGETNSAISCINDGKGAALTGQSVTGITVTGSQRSNRSRKVTSKPATMGATTTSAINASSGNRKQKQRAEYHPPSASSKNPKRRRSMRSTTSKDGLEEVKMPATLIASCKSNHSLAGILSKKESAISLLSQNNAKAVGNKAVIKNTKKRRQSKAGMGSVNSSAVAEDHKSLSSRTQKNRNRIMVKSTSSVSVRDEAAASERITKSQKAARGGSTHLGENNKVASSDMLKSSVKSGIKSISNWNESQKSDKKQASQKLALAEISPKALENIISDNIAREPQDVESPDLIIAGQDLQDANGQEDAAISSPGPNMPASPASQAPGFKALALHSPHIVDQQDDRIAEVDEESPKSADPVAHAAASNFKNDNNGSKMTSFGIKLKKLEISTTEAQIQDSNVEPSRQISLLEATPSSIIHEMTPNHEQEVKVDGDGQAVRPELSAPLPILPKVMTAINLPVKCPIENIRFLNLKRFQSFQKAHAEQMAAGYDLIGQRRKMLQRQTEEKLKKGQGGVEQLAKIDDTTHFIKSVVYARDPKIIDQERQHVPQRDAFQHLNNLDVKVLIQRNQMLNAEDGKYASLSPRTRARAPQNQNRPGLDCQVYRLKDANDPTLVFESRFESGNLYLAQKVSDIEYNLLMSNDINTQGHTQWFFFQVKNTRANSKIRFNILNYSKPDSLFNYGMKVSVYSEKKSEDQSMGWHKDCDDIRYFQNGIRKDVTNYARSYYTATFTYNFEYDDDTVFFAYSVPYTYSDLRNDIAAIESDPHRSKLVRKAVLCRTLSGEQCEVLTITSADNLDNFRKRKGVVITARVHPGETVGSWMMRGVLTFLTDPDNFEARMLRENFVFKVIPMLNPDGVINGNYRCSLAGCDLNRRWKVPNKTLHPTIWHTKRLVKSIHQERGLVMYCDLHGHSRKQNVFMYGCNNKANPGECRIFPFILGQMNPYFCYEYSRFGVQKSKEATARVALYKELVDVPNIFTMESSFAGCDEGPAAGKHFTEDMLETLGHDCCRAILIYCNLYVPPELLDKPFFKNLYLQQQAAKKKGGSDFDKKKFKEPAFNINQAINNEINNNKSLQCAGGDDSSSGSDSAPSEDNMQAEELVKQLPVADKTLKLQLKKNELQRKQDDKEKTQAEQSQAKLRKQSSLRKEDRDAPKRQLSPLKRGPLGHQEKKEDKPEEKKKPKVETRDACTQTDRSDYQLIKQKMLKERQLKEEQAVLAQNSQLRTKAGISTERQLINDLNGSNRQGSDQKKKSASFNTTQRMQQMVGITDKGQTRTNQPTKQMPLSSHFSQNPLMNQIQGQFNRGGNPLSHPQSTRNDQQSLLTPPSGPQQNINLPDKNKYNFMGVSSINKQGTPQQPQNNGGAIQENEYGTIMQHNTDFTPPASMQQNNEFPSMGATLSANSSKYGNGNKTQSHLKQQSQPLQQQLLQGPMAINNMLSSSNNNHNAPDSAQGGPPGSQRLRNDAAFSPMRKGVSGGQTLVNPQLTLPQAKQLPQKEFVMLEVGKAAKGMRKGSRNPKSSVNNIMLMGSQNPNNIQVATPQAGSNKNPPNVQGVGSANQHHYNTMVKQFSSTQNHRQYPQLATEPSEQQDTQSNRFKRASQQQQQQPQILQGQAQQKQLVSLARNNSMVLNAADSTPAVRASPADQYSAQLQDMSLSQNLVTRNTPATQNISAQKQHNNAHSVIETSAESGQYRAALSSVLTPSTQNSNMARYKAGIGQGDGKLPALNVRGGPQQQQPKTVRSEFANSSGVIGGLNIVLSSGQGSLQTPQQKMQSAPLNFQMSTHSQKMQQNGSNVAGQQAQPKLIGPSMHVTSHSGNPASNAAGVPVSRTKSDSKTGVHKNSTSTNSVNRQKQSWQTHNQNCNNPPGQGAGGHGARQNQLNAGGTLQIQTSSATHKRNTSRPIFIGGPQTTTAAGLQPGSLSHEGGQITMRQQSHNLDLQHSSPVVLANKHQMAMSGGGQTATTGPNHMHQVGPTAQSQNGSKTQTTSKQRTHILSNNSINTGNANHPLQGKVVGKRYSRH